MQQRHIISQNRRIPITAAFDRTEETEANRYMLTHEDEGVIATTRNEILLAKMDERGEEILGRPVLHNGFRGRIVRVCEWSEGLVEVQLPGGLNCTSVDTLIFL